MRIRSRTLKKIARDGPSPQRSRKLAEIERKIQLSHKKEKEKVEKKVIKSIKKNRIFFSKTQN